MDKATKVAVEKYPHGKFDGELGDSLRAACAIGYMQAQKDLALTCEDVAYIVDTFYAVEGNTKEKCEEVIKRFNEYKKLV